LGGGIFIYSCSARRISFESDCFYGIEHEYMNIYPPSPLSRLYRNGTVKGNSMNIEIRFPYLKEVLKWRGKSFKAFFKSRLFLDLKKSFWYQEAKLWNSLPINAIDACNYFANYVLTPKALFCTNINKVIYQAVSWEALFIGGGGTEREVQRLEEIFKFRVSGIPFPGLWRRLDRILMVRIWACRNLQFSIVLNGQRHT
jgi:hypothetical protein